MKGTSSDSTSLYRSVNRAEFGFADQQRADLWYGASGTGKTENLGLAALELWEEHGLVTRFISADGGGWKPLNPYVRLGIIQPISINVLEHPLRVVMALARGFWPIQKPDGKTVYVPVTEKVIEGDEKNGIPPVGGWMAEGLTSMANKIMIATLKDKNIKVPEQPKDCFVKDGEDEIWYFAGRSNYLFVQQRVQEFVDIVNTLPFKRIILTALEAKGKDPENDEACYGPKAIGQALTGQIPSWFGDCVHLEVVDTGDFEEDKRTDYKATVKGKGIKKRIHRAYIAPHPDPSTGFQFLAKSRISSWVNHDVPKFFDIPAATNPEEPWLDSSRGAYYLYQLEKKMEDKAVDTLKKALKRPAPVDMYATLGKSMSQGIDVKQFIDKTQEAFVVDAVEEKKETNETVNETSNNSTESESQTKEETQKE